MTQNIPTVRQVGFDGSTYTARCPHCSEIMDLEGEDFDDIRGEMYQHQQPHCAAWMTVDYDAEQVAVSAAWEVQVIEDATGEVVKRLPASDRRRAEKIESGLEGNLNHEQFTCRIVQTQG